MNLRNLGLAAAALLLAGCTTSITNLTPSAQPRNANHIYPFEVAYKTTHDSVRKDTLKPYVMVGNDLYPMRPTPKIQNRWEALVPIPAGTNYLYYRYKFDYNYARMPKAGENSRLSPTYQMEIVNK